MSRLSSWFGRAFLAAILGMPAPAVLAGGFRPDVPADTTLRPLTFAALSGWAQDDLSKAVGPFRDTCRAILVPPADPALRPVVPTPPALAAICRRALETPLETDAAARKFFEREFRPYEVLPPVGHGFLTGYFEPEVDGSLTRTADFTAPLLARPADIVTLRRGQTFAGLPVKLTAARRLPDGTLVPAPDRAAILDGALGDSARPLVWLRDAVAVFIVQVQGSTRVRFADGTTRRYAYAGRNGLPYTSIGKRIVDEGHVPLADMTLERMTDWLRAHPAEGNRLMRLNRSYVFFREAPEIPGSLGPVGASGASLTPWRGIAVDRGIWPFGLPVWLEAKLPRRDGTHEDFRKLAIAEDTGAAIAGPARVDLFTGTGEAAGTRAGLFRHPVRFIVLLPRSGR